MMEFVPLVFILFIAACASFTDIWNFKVYNKLTVPCFVLGVTYFSITHGWDGFLGSLSGAAMGFFMLIIPYMMGGVGAGDVKFVMAIGTWLSPAMLLPAIVVGCVATGIYSLVLMLRYSGAKDAWLNFQLMFFRLATIGKHLKFEDDYENVQKIVQSSDRRRKLIPFSAMVSVGIVATLLVHWWASAPT